MAKRRTSMVQPKPGPVFEQTEMKGADVALEFVLEQLCVDRPYTILSRQGDTWRVHFYGDAAPSAVSWKGQKPVIVKD
jgi:hypothetical protein